MGPESALVPFPIRRSPEASEFEPTSDGGVLATGLGEEEEEEEDDDDEEEGLGDTVLGGNGCVGLSAAHVVKRSMCTSVQVLQLPLLA